MTTPHEQHDKQAPARAALVAAARKIAEGQEDLRAAVVQAREVDIPVAEIARLADISRPTVYYWTKVD